MIQKINIHLFIIMSSYSLLGQTQSGFYLEPTITKKLHISSKKSMEDMQLETPYFIIKKIQYIFPTGLNHALGLNIGYCFKNQHKIQLGIAQDEILQGYTFVGTAMNSSAGIPTYSQIVFTKYSSVAFTNFSLLYKRHILHFQSKAFNPNRQLRVHLNIGLTYLYKPNNGYEYLRNNNTLSFMAPDSSLLSISTVESSYPANPKYSFKLNCGIDFTFCKKNKEQFSLNVSLIMNRLDEGFTYSNSSISIDVKNKAHGLIYSKSISGKGNGIYFTLSKRLYPLEIRKARKEKRKTRTKS